MKVYQIGPKIMFVTTDVSGFTVLMVKFVKVLKFPPGYVQVLLLLLSGFTQSLNHGGLSIFKPEKFFFHSSFFTQHSKRTVDSKILYVAVS